MSHIQRLILFTRDLITELPTAWSLARANDCERQGGHQWDAITYNHTMQTYGQTCHRCQSWKTAAITPWSWSSATGTAYTMVITTSN